MRIKLVLKIDDFLHTRGYTHKTASQFTGIRAPSFSEIKKKTVINKEHLEKLANAFGVTDIRKFIDFVVVEDEEKEKE